MMKHSDSELCAVSGCLLGELCRYDKKRRPPIENPPWENLQTVSVCPELAGGLGVPRIPCEIVGGDGWDVLSGNARVISCDGRDMTNEYVKGAELCAKLCVDAGVKTAFLKSKSPSCGVGSIYDGTNTGKLIQGDGVFTALLRQMGIKVVEMG